MNSKGVEREDSQKHQDEGLACFGAAAAVCYLHCVSWSR